MPNLYNLIGTEFSSAVIVFNIALAFALSFFITKVYIWTHRGISYSQSYVVSLIIIAILGATVMMVVQSNIVAAVGLLGAFSLIRFRTILKETRDVAFLFFALAVGVAVGTANYSIALFVTVLLSVIIMLLNKYNFGSMRGSDFILTVLAENHFGEADYRDIFDGYLRGFNLLHAKLLDDKRQEFAFSLNFKDPSQVGQFLAELKDIAPVVTVDLIGNKSSTEY